MLPLVIREFHELKMWDICSLFSAVHRNVFAKDGFYVIWNYKHPEKNYNFGKSSTFPRIPTGNFRGCSPVATMVGSIFRH